MHSKGAMRIKSIIRLLFIGAMLCISGFVMSQPPTGPLIISPKVHADKKVTFSYRAPGAKEVILDGQFPPGKVPMVKDGYGVWSVTVGPIKPDIYPYSFRVDGVTVMDPANVDFFPNERFKGSLLDVPGEPPLIHAQRDVPHGAVSYANYPSIEGSTGSVVIYTPPGYDKNTSERFPVFYLISGTTDTEETFYKVGRTNFILDNLIAEGKAKPMIVVMPYGNPAARIAEQKGRSKPTDLMSRDGEDAVNRAKMFETDLITKLIPYVERNYRTLNNRENRAIGGFSRGGGQTLRTAFGNMDQFSWICCYSAYLSTPEMEKTFKHVYDDPVSTNKDLKLFWIGVGNEDFLYHDAVKFIDFLKEKKVKHTSLITPGGHTWMNVKTYVTETAQLLFK
ncbi:alpha/beta hydrolase-fold protein [Arcticibacter sp.]|uniref:alpha/beta hydrolase-fold protein n=1 Tax=Arcticibacter sp. TaxID=1872630 RepID=UPI00388F96EA